jgi:hypothetical protein
VQSRSTPKDRRSAPPNIPLEPLTRDFGEFGEFGLGGGPQLLLDSEEVPVIFKAFGTF